MRIRPYLPADLKKLKAAFPSLKTKPTVRGAAVLWEDSDIPLAFAWAEPVPGQKHRWEVRFLAAVEERQGLGLESQVLITLELEIEKRAGKFLSIWTPADLPATPPHPLREMVKLRGYRFREYDSGYVKRGEPLDRYEKELYPDEFSQEKGSPGHDDGDEGGGEARPRFPLLSMN